MSRNATKVSSEKPLQGAVLCCTSIAPEDRSRLAEYAQQMGAEHKLDLTSDVTHLIVGSTDTPKYAYVARERDDVKVLRPEWVEAVRQVWMEDRKLDMNQLEAEYRVPTFAGLRICITGFDDLDFRSKLAENVKQQGGEYCGDLTKDVTHLVAAGPEGKKYEYATTWGKKIVSIKWYRDTLSRGMQLNEESYHPTISSNKQGDGAWNRQQPTIGKRPRVDEPSQEPARKLRRAASAKYGGQTDNMWGDIVGAANTDQPAPRNHDVLRPSRSMTTMQHQGLAQPDMILAHTNREPVRADPSRDRDKYLSGCYVTIEGFDSKRKHVLQEVLQRTGAQVYSILADLMTEELVQSSNSFIMVPHTTKQSALPYLGRSSIKPNFVSELWLEQCMACKQFVSVQDYPIGGIIEEATHPEIDNFIINATGFESIMTLHISKVVRLTGAKYSEKFSPTCSVLVMNSKLQTSSHHKKDAARQWKIPVVSEKWLWRFIRGGTIPSFDIQSRQTSDDDDDNDLQRQLGQKRQGQLNRQQSTKIDGRPTNLRGDGFKDERIGSVTRDSMPVENAETETSSAAAIDVNIRRSYSEQRTDRENMPRPAIAKTVGLKLGTADGPLQEVSPNSPTKRMQDYAHIKPPVPSYDGTSSAKEDSWEIIPKPVPSAEEANEKPKSPTNLRRNVSAMNIAIQDLLDAKTKSKTSVSKTEQDAAGKGKKKRLLGRALSNLSNSSRTSNPRQSRASSIDSINTDGVGSELLLPSGHSKATPDEGADTSVQRTNSFTLTGRANRRTLSIPALPPPIDISDPNLCRDEFADDHSPQLTQLGYEDSEEALALRERLAEKRRTRSKLGQQEGDPLPSIRDKDKNKSHDEPKNDTTTTTTATSVKSKRNEKRIMMDDEAMLALEDQVGWGGGRRTRLRDKKRNVDGDDITF